MKMFLVGSLNLHKKVVVFKFLYGYKFSYEPEHMARTPSLIFLELKVFNIVRERILQTMEVLRRHTELIVSNKNI